MSLLDWLRQKEYPEDLYLNPCREVANASQPFADLPATSHLCQTETCPGTATHIIARSLRHKEVCRDCSDELTVLGGWEWVSRI